MERHLVFDGGIAYGIDQLLEPPNLGARCDGLDQKQIHVRYYQVLSKKKYF